MAALSLMAGCSLGALENFVEKFVRFSDGFA
jgi:hypothetical protein